MKQPSAVRNLVLRSCYLFVPGLLPQTLLDRNCSWWRWTGWAADFQFPFTNKCGQLKSFDRAAEIKPEIPDLESPAMGKSTTQSGRPKSTRH